MTNTAKLDYDKSYLFRYRRGDPITSSMSPQQYALYVELFDPFECDKDFRYRESVRASDPKGFWGHAQNYIFGIMAIIFISPIAYPPIFVGFVWAVYGLIPSLRKYQDDAAAWALIVSLAAMCSVGAYRTSARYLGRKWAREEEWRKKSEVEKKATLERRHALWQDEKRLLGKEANAFLALNDGRKLSPKEREQWLSKFYARRIEEHCRRRREYLARLETAATRRHD